MDRKIIRARLLSFLRDPQTPDDTDSFRYIEDGGLLIEGGLIRAFDTFDRIDATGAEVIDHRPHLVLPGFIDTHLHFPQTQVIA
ncbi:MAG: guanine deaminase, partial [Rhodobacteraceae bacterium]